MEWFFNSREMDVITKLTDTDVAAFDQLLLAIRTLEADGGGRVTPNDLRNLRVIAQNLVQTKLDSLQVLERYEAFVRGKDAESRAERKQLEADLSDLKRSAEQRGGRRAANLEAQLQLKTEECEYLRRVNAELQAEGGAGRGEAEEAQEALKLKAAEVESLRAELAERSAELESVVAAHEEEIDRIEETAEVRQDRQRDDYEAQIRDLVAGSESAGRASGEERRALAEKLEAQASEMEAQASEVEDLRKQLSFARAELEVKSRLADKLSGENEDLARKYRDQSSRCRQLREEVASAHDQRDSEKKELMEEIESLMEKVAGLSKAASKGQEGEPEPRDPAPAAQEPPAAPLVAEDEAEEDDSSSSGDEEEAARDVLQDRLRESTPGARLLAPPSPDGGDGAGAPPEPSSFQKTLGEVLRRGDKDGGDGAEHVEVFYDGRWWRARVNDRNEDTKRMSVVFGPQGNELIQWVPFKSLRVRPVPGVEEEEEEEDGTSELTMDEFFMSNGAASSEEDGDGDDGSAPRGEEGGDAKKKKTKKKRFKALRRFSSMGGLRRQGLGQTPASGKRSRFLSVA